MEYTCWRLKNVPIAGPQKTFQQAHDVETTYWCQSTPRFSLQYYIASDNIQLFHAFMGNSPIYRHEVLWTTRSTIARDRQAEGDSASGRPQYRGAIVGLLPVTGME